MSIQRLMLAVTTGIGLVTTLSVADNHVIFAALLTTPVAAVVIRQLLRDPASHQGFWRVALVRSMIAVVLAIGMVKTLSFTPLTGWDTWFESGPFLSFCNEDGATVATWFPSNHSPPEIERLRASVEVVNESDRWYHPPGWLDRLKHRTLADVDWGHQYCFLVRSPPFSITVRIPDLYPALVLGLILAGWIERRTRPHEAGRCRRCGYCLTGNISGICPECGEKLAPIAAR